MIVGIDLGTSRSEVAYLKNGKPVLIPILGGVHGIVPSVVGVDPTLRVGQQADRMLVPKPASTLAEVKRLMGTNARLQMAGEEYTPQEISAIILRHLKLQAEEHLGETVDEAVVTVPAYFNALQRRATIDAADLAGLRVRRLINEPTAAALAYGIERPDVEEKVLVYDLGGGTFDVTVLDLSEGVLEVLAVEGNAELGGKDFDECIMAHLMAECRQVMDLDVSCIPRKERRDKFTARFREVARRAKEDLSLVDTTAVIVEGLTPEMDRDFETELTRGIFEDLIKDLVLSTREQLDSALRAANGLRPTDIDTVLLIGGSTHIPLVRRFVSEYFDGRTLRTEVSPDEAVALGAAIVSGMESGEIDPEHLVITDVCSYTLGIAVVDEHDGERTRDTFDPLILKNQTLPRTRHKRYSTVVDGQEAVRIRAFQGEAPLCEDNLFVGEVELLLEPPAPAGEPVEVTFSHDLSGDLHVAARDLRTGREARATFKAMAERMSDADRAAARARLEHLWQGSESNRGPTAGGGRRRSEPVPRPARTRYEDSPLYPRAAALLNFAEMRLDSLPDGVQLRATELVAAIKSLLAKGDETGLAQAQRELTELLFDIA